MLGELSRVLGSNKLDGNSDKAVQSAFRPKPKTRLKEIASGLLEEAVLLDMQDDVAVLILQQSFCESSRIGVVQYKCLETK